MGKTLGLLLSAVVVGGLVGYAVLVLSQHQQTAPETSNDGTTVGPQACPPICPEDADNFLPAARFATTQARVDLSPNRPDGLISIGPGPRRWE